MENQHGIKKIVFNDKLGYAIAYYDPAESVRSDNICEHRKNKVFRHLEEQDKIFYDEIQAMVRRKEREDAEKEIKKICEKVNDLFFQVEQADLSRREFLSHTVKQQIKGKSADEICKILVDDVLEHAKVIPRPKDNVDHKQKFKILSASTNQASQENQVRKSSSVKCVFNTDVLNRVEAVLDKSLDSEIHSRKLTRILDKIQKDLTLLKRDCTKKIDFNY